MSKGLARADFTCSVWLPEWRLHVAYLARRVERDLGNVMDMATRGVLAHVRRTFPNGRLESAPTVVAIRENLVRMGLDPGATPPSSELLMRELLDALIPARGTLVWEFLTILVTKSEAPWSALDMGDLRPPLEFRLGAVGESLVTARGAIECAGLPILADQSGVKASPWTPPGSRDLEGCRDVLFVCYLPATLFRAIEPKAHLGRAIWLTWAYRFIFQRTFPREAGAA